MRKLSPEERLKVVERVVNGGEPVSKVCREFNISRPIFYRYKKRWQEAEDKFSALQDRKPKIERYWRQATPEQEKAVLNLVLKYPEYSYQQLAQQFGTTIGLGEHGIQNILNRFDLNTQEKRLAYQQASGLAAPSIPTYPSPTTLPISLPKPLPLRKIPFLFIFLILLFLYGVYRFSLFIIEAPPNERIGLTLASIALFFGAIFFLYSLKYYLSMVLWGFASSTRNNNNNNQNGLNNNRLAFLNSPPFVSIHLPFYNEKKVASRILTACTSMDYENYEIVVVDDSTDETIGILEKWKAHPKVKVIHRTSREGFKGGALKVALEHSDPRTEFVIVFDADFIPYPDTIWQFLKYFNIATNGANSTGRIANSAKSQALSANNLENGNYKTSNIAAVQGYQWHVLNKTENWITKGVRTEYAGSYVVERPMIELFGGLKQIAGSVYMIRADILRKYGWGTSITEDFQLTLRLYADGFKVLFTPYIQAPSECVSTIKRLIRQRMRWAEGHTHQIKKMFFQLLFSPYMRIREKLEFLYLSPYYLQAVFFLLGTLCWFISDAILRTPLPFWTALWGWSLVFTNFLALPLMNSFGLFTEESPKRDFHGILTFIALVYFLAPFQAYAALKGLLEKEEGHWFRTPKTGLITDFYFRFRFRRWLEKLLPGRKRLKPEEEKFPGDYRPFDSFKIQNRPLKRIWVRGAIALLIISAVILSIYARNVPKVLATNPDIYYLHNTNTSSITPAGKYKNTTIGSAGTPATVQVSVFNPNAYWYTDTTLPTGTYISAGSTIFHSHQTWACTGGDYQQIRFHFGYSDSDGSNYVSLGTYDDDCDDELCSFISDYYIATSGASNLGGKRFRFRIENIYDDCGEPYLLSFDQDSSGADSYVDPPAIVVPENVIILVFIIPFLPWLVKKLQQQKVKI